MTQQLQSIFIILIIVLISIILSGCISEPQKKNDPFFTPYQVKKYHDDELSVTCWITDANTSFGAQIAWGGGISCIPDDMIQINK